MEGSVDVFTGNTPIDNWELIVAFLLPLAIALIIQSHWPAWAKSLTMFGVSILITVVGMYLTGELNDVSTETVVSKILAVTVGTIAFYKGLWKPTGVAPAIEQATTVTAPPGA